MSEHNLLSQNKPRSFHTFSGPSGSSDIDVTFTSSNLLGFCKNWQIIPDAVLTDHRAISFDLLFSSIISPTRNDPRINIRKANWLKFCNALANYMATFNDSLDIHYRANSLTQALVKAARCSIPLHRPGGHPIWK